MLFAYLAGYSKLQIFNSFFFSCCKYALLWSMQPCRGEGLIALNPDSLIRYEYTSYVMCVMCVTLLCSLLINFYVCKLQSRITCSVQVFVVIGIKYLTHDQTHDLVP